VSGKKHWEDVHGRKEPDRASRYRPRLERSLEFIDGAGLTTRAAIIDVGGGASTLVDDLLDRGYEDITVLDLSARALALSRRGHQPFCPRTPLRVRQPERAPPRAPQCSCRWWRSGACGCA
jgi:hypothetical protein